ncbi:MAG: nitroreductase family protein, partial [Bdellovibrionales bacterium]|nr:nitroreductase family protein [Bdellovibrionales bacterium]
HRHRSIRKYEPREVPEALLEQILQAGIRASSSGNMQAYSVIVTRSQELRERLFAPHFSQPMVKEAPVLLTFCADFHRMRSWLRLREAQLNFDNLMSFLIGAIDAILVSQNVALAAESEGLGVCYMGTTLANCQEIGEVLECPAHVVPVVGFSLGYPAEAPEQRDRLPQPLLVHQETYQARSDEEILAGYENREREGWRRYMSQPDLRQLVEKAGVENLAQIYTHLKYTRQSHQDYSRQVLDYLVQQGFVSS